MLTASNTQKHIVVRKTEIVCPITDITGTHMKQTYIFDEIGSTFVGTGK
jgi:hypothetical protein